MMCKKDKEIIVKLIKSGKDSYADFCEVLGNVDIFIICQESQIPGAIIKRKPPVKPGKISLDTRFELTTAGKDLLYDVEQWEKMYGTSETSAKYAKKAYRATVFIGVATIILSVLLQCLARLMQ